MKGSKHQPKPGRPHVRDGAVDRSANTAVKKIPLQATEPPKAWGLRLRRPPPGKEQALHRHGLGLEGFTTAVFILAGC